MSRRKTHCNQCGGERQHDVLWTQSVKYVEHNWTEGADHYVVQCRGCEWISYQVSWWHSDLRDEDNQVLLDVKSYPPRTVRKKPHWHSDFLLEMAFKDDHFLHLLDEIYVALQNDSLRLAAMGIRALLESIMIEKCGDQGTFKANLNEFQKLGHISFTQRTAVEPVIEAGHAATHRSFKPEQSDALIALDITENIIESIYVAGQKAGKLKIPPRRP
jgi:hypothetical protein